MKILIYGDSNTYGYDPADLWEYRYPLQKRWTYLLAQMNPAQWEIIPEGMNGRPLPVLKYDAQRIQSLMEILQEGDLFAVMLGTNDLLRTIHPDAEEPAEKMRAFLQFLTAQRRPSDILVIAPPYISRSEVRDPLYQRYHQESRKMNARFQELAEFFGVRFVDAGPWEVGLSADLVHLSEEGHSRFAQKMGRYLLCETQFAVK